MGGLVLAADASTPVLLVVGVLAAALILDLGLRFIVFGRLESAAMDLLIFSCLFTAIEAVHARDDSAVIGTWIGKLGGLFVALVALVAYHRLLEEQATKQFEKVLGPLHNAGSKQVNERLRALEPLARRATFTALWASKPGKKEQRRELEHALLGLGLAREESITADDFLLPQWQRRLALSIFAIAGILAVVVPLIPPTG